MCQESPAPEYCHVCRAPLEDFSWFSDGQIITEELQGGWAVLCPDCYPFYSKKALTGTGIETIFFKKEVKADDF